MGMDTSEVRVSRRSHAERGGFDRWLWFVTLCLLMLGTVVILDASSPRALQSNQSGFDDLFYFKKQLMWVAISVVVLLAGMQFPYWRLRDWKVWFLGSLVALALLVLVLIPGIGVEVGGARRWLSLAGQRFQPSEFAKIMLIIFLARYSELWRSRISHFWKGFVPPVLFIVLVGGLIAKEDLGTAIVAITTGLLMMFMMGAQPKHMLGLTAVSVVAAVGLIITDKERTERVTTWIDLIFRPLEHHTGAAYQPAQGLIAVGSGGVWGKGIGLGTAKHMYLPAEHTDYIFATIGEETGLIGCVTLLCIFAWLIIRGLNVAHRTRDWFGSLLAAGLTSMIGVQVLLNIAVVTGLVPCTGVPLPFISYGGSSVLFTTFAVAVVLNISRFPERPDRVGASDSTKERRSRESDSDGWGDRRPHLSRP
jgi:cell division protein FtsW